MSKNDRNQNDRTAGTIYLFGRGGAAAEEKEEEEEE